MTHSDDHSVARREGNPTEARGRQDPSAMSVPYQNGYEGHGGSSGGVHNPPLTQARESQDPSAMSGHSSVYGIAYKGQGGSPGVVHSPRSNQVSSTGYGIGYNLHSGFKYPSHKSPSPENTGNKSHSASYGTGYNRHSGYKDSATPTEITGNQPKVSSTGYGDGDGHHSNNKYPPTTEVTGNQTHVSSLGNGTGYDQVSGNKDHDPPIKHQEKPHHVPGSVGGSGYPAKDKSPAEAQRKRSEPSHHTSEPTTKTSPEIPSVQVQVNVQNPPAPALAQPSPPPPPVQTPAARPGPARIPPPAPTPNVPPPKSYGCCSIL